MGKMGLKPGVGQSTNFKAGEGSVFKAGGGAFKPSGSRFGADTSSSYRGDPNESFQSMGGDGLNSSLMQSKIYQTPDSARGEEDKSPN